MMLADFQLADFHFLQPLWLLLFPLLVILSYVWLGGKQQKQQWSEVCDPELLPLLVKEGARGSRWPFVIAGTVSLLIAVAAAQPVWKKQPSPAFKQSNAVVIALDLSASMNAQDIKPSRLQRARFKIDDLLQQLKDSQVALIVYAGDVFPVIPLTEDVATIRAQLPIMSPEIMPVPGNRADKAIALAENMLTQAGITNGDVLLVSDEVNPAQVAGQANKLRQQGGRLFVLGVGTAQGAPVPTQTGVLKDRQGNTVIARAEFKSMREAAALGGGQAVMLSNNDRDVERLLADFNRDGEVLEQSAMTTTHWIAEGPWLVLFALPLFLLTFRRGVLSLLLPCLLLSNFLAVPDAHAGLWEDLWQTKDQQAAKQFSAGDAEAAAEQFKHPRWKQAAEYEAGQYEKALDTVAQPQSVNDWYNRGNILARLGKLDEAIEAYDQALQQQPDYEDAAHNKKLLEDLKKQQQQQSQQGQSNQNNQNQQQSEQNTEQNDQSSQQEQGQEQQQQQSEQGQQQQDQQQSQSSEQDESERQSEQQQANNSESEPSSDEQSSEQKQEQQQAEEFLQEQLDKQQQEQQQAQQEQDQQEQQNEAEQQAAVMNQAEEPIDEAEQARQQLLNRIEDDPARLWKRKFKYQYRQRAEQTPAEGKTW